MRLLPIGSGIDVQKPVASLSFENKTSHACPICNIQHFRLRSERTEQLYCFPYGMHDLVLPFLQGKSQARREQLAIQAAERLRQSLHLRKNARCASCRSTSNQRL